MSPLTPIEIVALRVDAHRSGDFPAIYATSHSESSLRTNFPRLDDYLNHVEEHVREKIRIVEFSIAESFTAETVVFVTARAKYRSAAEEIVVHEIHELRRESSGWRVLASCRRQVSVDDYANSPGRPEDYSTLPWF